MIKDDFSPVRVGATGEMIVPQLIDKNLEPINLTGLTITIRMELLEELEGIPSGVPIGTKKDCDDPMTIDDAANGLAHRQWKAADLNTPGIWGLWFILTDGSGHPRYGDDGIGNPKPLTILPAP